MLHVTMCSENRQSSDFCIWIEGKTSFIAGTVISSGMDRQAEGRALHWQEIPWHSQTVSIYQNTQPNRLPALHQMETDKTEKSA